MIKMSARPKNRLIIINMQRQEGRQGIGVDGRGHVDHPSSIVSAAALLAKTYTYITLPSSRATNEKYVHSSNILIALHCRFYTSLYSRTT